MRQKIIVFLLVLFILTSSYLYLSSNLLGPNYSACEECNQCLNTCLTLKINDYENCDWLGEFWEFDDPFITPEVTTLLESSCPTPGWSKESHPLFNGGEITICHCDLRCDFTLEYLIMGFPTSIYSTKAKLLDAIQNPRGAYHAVCTDIIPIAPIRCNKKQIVEINAKCKCVIT